MLIDRIAVLITSFNRRDLTMAALAALIAQRVIADTQLTIFLVDDGSTDGTGDAVRLQFPQVRVLEGDGTLFWNGGMRMAFESAKKEGFDAYILFNDDTFLYEDALERLVGCARDQLAAGKPAIVVGSTRSPVTGKRSYGGLMKRSHGLVVGMDVVMPLPSTSVSCNTMNGNFALIPAEIAEVVGNIEKGFRHSFGDIDYGLRASDAGFAVVVAPGYVGECSNNSTAGTWRDPSAPFAQRWKSLLSPKGVPVNDWLLFTRRHYGWRWFCYAASPYLKTIASSLFPRRSERSVSDDPTVKR
jgi:GT2 family glycosyltransferase